MREYICTLVEKNAISEKEGMHIEYLLNRLVLHGVKEPNLAEWWKHQAAIIKNNNGSDEPYPCYTSLLEYCGYLTQYQNK